MRVLVTGASGFIGRNIVKELLSHGYKVVGLTRNPDFSVKGADIVVGDITKKETLFDAFTNIDGVFHNAALTIDWGKKKDFQNVNVQGTKNVLHLCQKNGIGRIVYTSSAGVYGFPNTSETITENSPISPLNSYHQSKLDGETILYLAEETIVSSIRPPLVIGPNSHATKLILSKIFSNDIKYIGSGEQLISIVHPMDVAQCLRLAFEKDHIGDIFNAVSFTCSIKDLFTKISERLNVTTPDKHVPYFIAYLSAIISELLTRPPELTKFRVKLLGTTRQISCDKARQNLGYIPRHDINSTVEDIVKSYKK
ncbi:MAG: SDR family NAD(P)-dependent oxidoreductase [Candidatus Thermoplasmatota archaeon]|nr:SDR family NAD(P)-dependent oxidoreductase [Candidatus Thermoplasmatota archaeon]